jgi:hypothetical protein
MVAVEVFPRGTTRCLRPCFGDSHVYVGGSGGSIAVLSTQGWRVLHHYSCLPPSKKTPGGGGRADVMGNSTDRPSSRQRAASAGRIR